jgi:hypothetical protein
MYADWKAQVAYSTPNFNGFSATVGVTQAWNAIKVGTALLSGTSADRGGNEPAFEAKASYDFAVDAVKGKVWASGISQKVVNVGSASRTETATSGDIGANLNAAGFGLTGYYYEGKGIGQTVQFNDGFDALGNERKSDGYYVQATYAIPGVATKLGVSYGESKLKGNAGEAATLVNMTDEMWVGGIYHPITKHLNLVAEYSEATHDVNATTSSNDTKSKGKTVSLGAILFF